MKYVLIFIGAFFLASCSNSHRVPTLVSTKATAVPPHRVLGKVETKDCQYTIMLNTLSYVDFRAMQSKILEQTQELGGDAVVDFKIRSISLTNIIFLYMSQCFEAVGTVVRFRDSSLDGGPSIWDMPSGTEEKQETKSVWD